jgi:hypothetical protein
MGYDIYFINETKKQLFSAKVLNSGDLEDNSSVCKYLSTCVGDTLRIADEGDSAVEEARFSDNPQYEIIEPGPHA